jgi:hypothetical protein
MAALAVLVAAVTVETLAAIMDQPERQTLVAAEAARAECFRQQAAHIPAVTAAPVSSF